MMHFPEGLLNAYLDGALRSDDELPMEIGRHLLVCASCRQRLRIARDHRMLCELALRDLDATADAVRSAPHTRLGTSMAVRSVRPRLLQAAVVVLTCCAGAALVLLNPLPLKQELVHNHGGSSPAPAPVRGGYVDVAPVPNASRKDAEREVLSHELPQLSVPSALASHLAGERAASTHDIHLLPEIPLPRPPLTQTADRPPANAYAAAPVFASGYTDTAEPELSPAPRRELALRDKRSMTPVIPATRAPTRMRAPASGLRPRSPAVVTTNRSPAAAAAKAEDAQPSTLNTGGNMRHTCAGALGMLLALAGCDSMPLASTPGDLQATISDATILTYRGSGAFRTAPSELPRPSAFTLWSEGYGASAGAGFQFSSDTQLAAGTYPLNAADGATRVQASYVRRNGSLVEKYSAMAGVLEITSSTADRIEGTFRFEGMRSAVCTTGGGAVSCAVSGADAAVVEATGNFVAHRVHAGYPRF